MTQYKNIAEAFRQGKFLWIHTMRIYNILPGWTSKFQSQTSDDQCTFTLFFPFPDHTKNTSWCQNDSIRDSKNNEKFHRRHFLRKSKGSCKDSKSFFSFLFHLCSSYKRFLFLPNSNAVICGTKVPLVNFLHFIFSNSNGVICGRKVPLVNFFHLNQNRWK